MSCQHCKNLPTIEGSHFTIPELQRLAKHYHAQVKKWQGFENVTKKRIKTLQKQAKKALANS